MVYRVVAVTATLAAFAAQSQAPPLPPSSPFAAAAIKRPVDDGPPVTLTFAWPAGMSATIESERIKTTISPAGQQTERAGLMYRMRVSAHPDGRLIEYDSFQPTGLLVGSPEQAALERMMSSLMPSVVVSETGQFIRIGDLTKIRNALRQMLGELKKNAPAGVPANVEAMLNSLATDKVLTQAAQAEWVALVGAYVGFVGTVGTATEFDSQESLPMLPGAVLPMRTSFGARARRACWPGQLGDTCVVMQMRSVVAPGAMQAVLKKLMDGVKGAEGLKYDTFNVVTDVQTTLEPSTMRPHFVERTKTADFTMVLPRQPRASASSIERRTYRFRYES